MVLRAIRQEKGLTQKEAAKLLGVSLRSYITYENGEDKLSEAKLKIFRQILSEYGFIDEEHGVLTIDKIREICTSVFKEYGAEYAYLFGSYAKGTATDRSDVDLLVSINADGLKFFELVESLRENLKKRVDLIDLSQLNNNSQLVCEILKYGIKIYG